MRYVMKEKVWSLGEAFTIEDARGRDVAIVVGKAWSLGDKLSFQDLAGRELAFIKQVVLTPRPTYELHRGGRLAAIVEKKAFTLVRAVFTIDVPGPDDLVAEGDFTGHEYTFLRADRPVARVSRQFFAWRDTYGVDIDEGEDVVLILATTVVIDLVMADRD
jgi:uncharacterized protein YxjI